MNYNRQHPNIAELASAVGTFYGGDIRLAILFFPMVSTVVSSIASEEPPSRSRASQDSRFVYRAWRTNTATP